MALKVNSGLSTNFNLQSRTHNQQQRCVCVFGWTLKQTMIQQTDLHVPRILHFPQDGVHVCVTTPKYLFFSLFEHLPLDVLVSSSSEKLLHYSFMPQRKCAVIVKVRLRGGQMDPLLLIQHSNRPVWLWPKSTPEVIPMTQRSFETCSASSALIWLWSDFQAEIFWGSLNASMENRCPLVKGFRFSSPTSAYKQDVLLQWSKQISKSVFVKKKKWLTDVWAVEKKAALGRCETVCEDLKWLVSWKALYYCWNYPLGALTTWWKCFNFELNHRRGKPCLCFRNHCPMWFTSAEPGSTPSISYFTKNTFICAHPSLLVWGWCGLHHAGIIASHLKYKSGMWNDREKSE